MVSQLKGGGGEVSWDNIPTFAFFCLFVRQASSDQIQLQNQSHFPNTTLSPHISSPPQHISRWSNLMSGEVATPCTLVALNSTPATRFCFHLLILKTFPDSFLLQKWDKKILRLPSCLRRFSSCRHSYCLKVSGHETISPHPTEVK